MLKNNLQQLKSVFLLLLYPIGFVEPFRSCIFMKIFKTMQKQPLFTCLFIAVATVGFGQNLYVPAPGNWETRTPEQVGMSSSSLSAAVEFAQASEIDQPRDLRLAIIKGFEREPYHKLLGPVKKRGGTAGMIIKNGYIVAQWGDVDRVDMTFSVTKSFLSTVAGWAVDQNLLKVNDPVVNYVWDGTFDGAHNSQIRWKDLLNSLRTGQAGYGAVKTGPTARPAKVMWTTGNFGNSNSRVRFSNTTMSGLMCFPIACCRY